LQKYLNKELQPSQATIISFSSLNGIGHSTVAAKDESGKLCIIEPQQKCAVMPFNIEYFTNWIKTNTNAETDGLTSIYLISKSEFYIPEQVIENKADIKTLVSWSISKQQIANWKYLNPELPRNAVYDCYYNVFKFLSILPDDIAEQLSKLANKDADCVTQNNLDSRFLSIMRDYTTDKFKQIYKYDIFKYELRTTQGNIYYPYLRVFETYLMDNLISGSGTIVWLYRSYAIGHCVIIYRDGDNFTIIDPQQCKMRNISSWQSWFTRQQITHIGVIEQIHTGKRKLTVAAKSVLSADSSATDTVSSISTASISPQPIKNRKKTRARRIQVSNRKMSISSSDKASERGTQTSRSRSKKAMEIYNSSSRSSNKSKSTRKNTSPFSL
jgi:hypothetical protein